MLGKNGIKVFDHIFTLKFLGDHFLPPCIIPYIYNLVKNKLPCYVVSGDKQKM
jgi:hypothetical protein